MKDCSRALLVNFILLVLACVTPPGVFAAKLVSSSTRDELVDKFDAMDQAINKGEGYSRSTNDNSVLAWAESYLLEAYLDMFEATRNAKYLASFVRHADRVVGNTDLKRGITDYGGRSVVGWNSTHYSRNGERLVWLVHSGMITYPLARFAWLVDNCMVVSYRSQALTYTDVAKSALAVFEKNWNYDASTGRGYYQFFADEPHSANSPNPPVPLPFNQQLAAGRTLIMLHKVTGNNEYREKAEALARHFRSNLKGNKGPYIWTYWYGKGLDRSKTIEDISHGAIDLDFAILAYRSGIVFNREDLSRFQETYEKNIHKSGTVANTVDGRGEGRYKNAIGRWLELAEFSCVPWKDFYAFYLLGDLGRHPEVMLGTAKLVKYFDKCFK